MCGICGIFTSNQHIDIKSEITNMNSLLKHRGPDDEGYILSDGSEIYSLAGNDTTNDVISHHNTPHISSFQKTPIWTMAHRRLSIIDTSAKGHQPMSTVNKGIWIVYNGEIYNHVLLRNELIELGYVFQSSSDTEVIITAYQAWGESCVERFNGMWAFVIYDNHQNKWFGSRDCLGVKPLYYYWDGNTFAFASEQKALNQCSLVNTNLNNQAVFDYLVLSHSHSKSFFNNINEIPAGSNFSFYINTSKFIINKYFDQEKRTPILFNSFEEATEKLNFQLKKTIKQHTIADVEVGSCLSGGIDSTIIVKILDLLHKKQHNKLKPKVFSAIYPGSLINEDKWIKEVIDSSDVIPHFTQPSGDELLTDIKDLIYYAETPLLSTSTYSQYRVMKLVHENGIKVLLDGQGADELFAGYDLFCSVYWNELINSFKLNTLLRELRNSGSYSENINNWLKNNIKHAIMHLNPTLIRKINDQTVWENRYIKSSFKDSHIKQFGDVTFPYGNDLNKVLIKYATGEKLQTMLHLEDRMSMRFSIESRTPFADDPDLIHLANSMPSKYKIHNGIRKHVLREAFKGIIPETIRTRRDKIGFQTPEQDWLTKLTPFLPDLISQNISEFVDIKKIKSDIHLFTNNPTSSNTSRILRYVFLSQWRNVYQR